MRYRINTFEFNSHSLVLSQNGKAVAIRHNEAKVLAILLQHPEKVFSKKDILSLVWQDKVVSEQAVFQNISHLRNVFGRNAIKTFPKRGYQWQLAIELLEESSLSTQKTIQKAYQPKLVVTAKKPPSWLSFRLIAMLFSFALIIIGTYIGITDLPSEPRQQNTHSIINLAYIPFTNSLAKSNLFPEGKLSIENTFSLESNNYFDFTKLNHLETASFTNSSELEYPALAKNYPFVLTGAIRSYKNTIYLDFWLKGPLADWQGQLSGITVKDVIQQLQQHLKQPFIYQFLSKTQSLELKQAQLSIAHQQAPEDLINLGQLINTYIRMEELERAMVLADKLANIAVKKHDIQQIGNGLLYQSEILARKELHKLSSHKLTSAIEHFEKINDLKRQADAWYAKSWLDHQQKDYQAIKVDLLKSAQLALSAKDIPRELDALTYLSVLAHKHHQTDDKYVYLRQAENKMKTYQLPIYHFAKIPFHYAIFTKTPSDKEPHYQQVLEFTKLTPDHWVAQNSRQRLMKYYIEQKRFKEAQALIEDLKTDNPNNTFLKALLAHATEEKDHFKRYAQRTFEQAQLAGDTQLSLDVALLLCSTPDDQVNYDFYSQYINDNATKHWRRYNKDKLLILNR